MSDGITLYCPFCKGFATKKEYEDLIVKIKGRNYETSLPIYTCENCGAKVVIEIVIKQKGELGK